MLAARPVATSIWSALSSVGSLPSGPTITLTPPASLPVRAPCAGDLDRLGLEAGVRHDVDAAALEGALQLDRDLAILERHEVGQVLEDGDLRAHVGVEAGELDTDRAAADHDQALGQHGRGQDVVAGHDDLAVRLEARQRLDAAAGSEDHIVRVERPMTGRGAVVADDVDLDLLAAVQPAATADELDLVLLDQAHEALGSRSTTWPRRLAMTREVDRGLAGRDPEVGGLLDPGVEIGRLEHRLGRDAADMEARAADLVGVDEGDLEAKLAGPEGGGVAAGAGAQDDQVEAVRRADGHGSTGSVHLWCRLERPIASRARAAAEDLTGAERHSGDGRGAGAHPQPRHVWLAPDRVRTWAAQGPHPKVGDVTPGPHPRTRRAAFADTEWNRG